MPRQARLDAPGMLHHMMVRGIEGCPGNETGGAGIKCMIARPDPILLFKR